MRHSLKALIAVLALIGVFETIVCVKPAYGQAVGYCGFGRPCKVSTLTATNITTGNFTATGGTFSVAGFASFAGGGQFGSNVIIPYMSGNTPFMLSSVQPAVILTTSLVLGGTQLPNHPFTMTDVGFYVSNAASGTGTVTFRVTDGTNNCDFANDCTLGIASIGGKIKTTTSGICTFAANAALTYSVLSAGCTVLQPNVKNIDWRGNWQ